MADIKGRTIAATYGKLLYTSTDDGLVGNTGSTTSVVTTDDMDGTSTASCLNLGIDRVGIGTPGPDGSFDISSTNAELYLKEWSSSLTTPPEIKLQKNRGTSVDGSNSSVLDNTELGKISFWGWNDVSTANQDEGASIFARVNGTPTNSNTDMPTELVFCTTAEGSATPSERMYILANGTVGIGVDDPDANLEVKNASMTSNSSANIKINGYGNSIENGTEIGVYYHSSQFDTNAPCSFMSMGPADKGAILYFWVDDGNTFRSSTASAHIGTAANGSTTAGTMSDERAKDISTDAFPYGLNAVNSLTPIKYQWKENFGVQNKDNIGLGAQSVKAIIPEAIEETHEDVDGLTNKLNIKYGELVPVLVKAVQELSAKVTALENA